MGTKNENQKKQILEEKLRNKETELVENQKTFEMYWEKHKDSPLYEKNAINQLLNMTQIKAEIEELKYILCFCQ